ncbi:MAG: sigma 54-interacting transcriptional regulator [Desulfobacteraceae bacterium]|nr:sigma 54-interacting transcriptional regulator [Desulfobacteraceae bacterium]
MYDFKGVAKSGSFLSILEQARQFAGIPRPVLVRGERGTGKELVARFIHDQSLRREKPFVVINCAAFTDELINAEIYGHEKGAFTGATETRTGKLEQADKGTLFMDEIGNMSPAFQDRILRVIEYQEFERIRGTKKIKVDVRIISATNADLDELITDNLFRRDLYDRLTFAELKIPPLRHRKDDIPHLIVHFVHELHMEMPNLMNKTFDRTTVEAMMDYYWPGNIRELKNIVERLYLYGSDDLILPSQLPAEITGIAITGESFNEKVEQYKRQLIFEALEKADNNQRDAAHELKMTYDQFRHYYKKYSQPSNIL